MKMRGIENAVVGVALGAVPAIACFLAGWWISIPLVPESRIFLCALAGLGLGVAVDALFLRGWIRHAYALRPLVWKAVYVFSSVGMFGFFMGVPVFHVLLALPAGVFVGRWLAHEGAAASRVEKAGRRTAAFTTGVLTLVCIAAATVALASESTAHDLLRGAGNLLGGQQSGHIHAVGLDLYVKLLEQSILELKGEAPPDAAPATLNLRVDLRIPSEYVPDVHQRMSLYKRVSQVNEAPQLDAIRAEMRDRYGAFPPQVEALLAYAGLRLRAERLGVQQVDLTAQALHVRFGPDAPLPPEAGPRLLRAPPGSAFTPQGALRVPVAPGAPPLVAVDGTLRALETVAARHSGPAAL